MVIQGNIATLFFATEVKCPKVN